LGKDENSFALEKSSVLIDRERESDVRVSQRNCAEKLKNFREIRIRVSGVRE
jgi:hypothetical protein